MTTAPLAPGAWTIDAAHTIVEFSVRHMTVARVTGRFSAVSGEVKVPDGDPLSATVSVSIDVSSVSSGHPKRDDLIRSADFLDAGQFAVITFTSGRAEDVTRFAPLKAEELSPPQKAWADMIAAPPRNAKFNNPPYRAYIRNPELAPRLTAMSEYLRWNTSLPPRLSELAILITARQWTAQYEWAVHYPLAIKGAGADEEVARARRTLRRLGVGDVTVLRAGGGKVDRAATVVRLIAGGH